MQKMNYTKTERFETLVRKLKEINPDADIEMIATHAESLIENHFRKFKKR
jgi:hypothetical protein